MPALLLLLLLPLLQAGPAEAQNETVTISLGIIWDSNAALLEFQQIFPKSIRPQLAAACPSNNRINRTEFQLDGFYVPGLPTVQQLLGVSVMLNNRAFVFMGIKSNTLTDLINRLPVATNISTIPRMQWTGIAPMPQHHLNKVVLDVVRWRINEGLYPKNRANFRAAFILNRSYRIKEMHTLFDFFVEGVVYYWFDSRELEENLLSIKRAGIINIIAFVDAQQGDELKVAAFRLSMLQYKYRWFFHGPRLINTNMDSRMVTHSKNITSIEFGRLFDVLNKDLRTQSSVMLYDLLSTWQPYLQQYLCNESAEINRTHGGYSGNFRLEPGGLVTRTRWDLEIYRGLELHTRQHVGSWNSDLGLFWMLRRPDPFRTEFDALLELQRNTFRIVTVMYPPYVVYKNDVADTAPLNERLTGFFIETCKMLLQQLQITNYEFFLQEDGSFGLFNESWNGLIRTLIDGKAHLACAPITIQTDRAQAVRFTDIIDLTRLSLLYRAPQQDPIVEIFQFIQPLDGFIWLSILGVLGFIAIVLAVMHLIIPNKGVNLSLYNSTYFSFAEVVQGTSGSVPNQISGRIVTAFFWFFTLFLLLTYIANYAAFRTLEGVKPRVTSLESLLENSEYSFGFIKDTSTANVLRDSTFVYMQQIYKLAMESASNGLVDNSSAAINVVNNETRKYVLINDYLQNKYWKETGCNLMNTGEFYRLKNAMAVPMDSEYLQFINDQIKINSSGIARYQNEFFTVNESEKADCQDPNILSVIRSNLPPNIAPVKAAALTLANTMGIALINIMGCLVALALSGIERCISRVLQSRSDERRTQQKTEAYAMAQRPTMRE